MKVEGLVSLERKLRALKEKAGKDEGLSASVGYTQNYALIVHEDLGAKHQAGKQAKFLEGPARRLKTELASIIGQVTYKTGSLSKGLLMAALRLLRESQQIVPIDTGALKASGFAALEKDVEQAATAAYDRALMMERSGKFKKESNREEKKRK